MNKKIFISLIVVLVIIVIGLGWILMGSNKGPVACTLEAKVCPDGSTVGRTGPNCEFAACPVVQDPTAGWQTVTDAEYGFSVKYPTGFFEANHAPRILDGDCNYSVFPSACPSINNIVINDMASAGGDINIIKQNLSSPTYWKVPTGEKSTVNGTSYCLYQTSDAAMSHVYNYYYYTTVVNNKCLVVTFDTSTTNCEVYLPLETGNTEQAKNYNDCLTTNANQPTTLSRIVSTFKFAK